MRKKVTHATRPQCPSSMLAKRFAAIMHRQETTPWHPKWIDAFRAMMPYVVDCDLLKIERRYRTLWPPNREKNSLRHDLYTLINNYLSEVDRANAWCDAHKEKKPRNIIQMPPIASAPYIASDGEVESVARFNQEREARGRESAFAKVKREMQG